MRRSVTRFVVSLWTLWFALITVGPGGFGACPEHGTGHDHSAVVAPVPATPPAADQHAGHAGMHHEMAHETAPASSDAPPAHHQCTCLGACCMMAPSALPASTEMLVATVTARPATPTPAYRTVIAARRVFSQPYAIGPPAAPTV